MHPDALAAMLGNPHQMSPPGPAGPPPGPQGQPDPHDPAHAQELLKQMLDIADEYKMGEQDEQDVLAIEKVTTMIQDLLAKQQQEQDGLASGKSTPRALRRALAGSGQ